MTRVEYRRHNRGGASGDGPRLIREGGDALDLWVREAVDCEPTARRRGCFADAAPPDLRRLGWVDGSRRGHSFATIPPDPGEQTSATQYTYKP